MNSQTPCPQCGTIKIIINEKESNIYCINGHLLDAVAMPQGPEFGGPTGQKLQGSVINPLAKTRINLCGRPTHVIDYLLVRTNRYEKAINSIANDLNINKQLREQALRYYNIASNMKYQKKNEDPTSLTQGRETEIVAAACLYIVCRMERKPHLLIDFADAIQKDLFKIAEVFQLFKKHIRVDGKTLEVPVIDPSWFIERFCKDLNFEEKEKDVQNTAIRLIQSMNRSWISTGRHPSGLCGAAILIAAKLHGFRRRPQEIVKVAHVCLEVIRKRVNEFKYLKTADLTRKEFKLKEIEQADPQKFDYEDYEPPEFILKQDQLELDPEQRLELRDQIYKEKNHLDSVMENVHGFNFDFYDMNEQANNKTNTSVKGSQTHEQNQLLCADQEKMNRQHDKKLGVPAQHDSDYQVSIHDMEKNSTQVMRQDMTIQTLDYNFKQGQVIDVTDNDTLEVVQLYLQSTPEAQLKEIIWKQQNAEYLKEVKHRKKMKADQQQKRRERKKQQGYQSHASQVSQSGMNLGGDSIGKGSGDQVSSEDLDLDSNQGVQNKLSKQSVKQKKQQDIFKTPQNTPGKKDEQQKLGKRKSAAYDQKTQFESTKQTKNENKMMKSLMHNLLSDVEDD